MYINVWFVTRKNEVLTISHMQKSCTPAVPRSVFFFCFGCLLGAAEVLMVAKYVPVVLKPSTSKSGPCSQKLVLRGAAERSYVRKSYKPIHVTYLTFYFGGSLVSQKLTGLYWMLEVVNCQLGQFLNFLVCNDAMVGLGDSRPGTRLSGCHDAWCSLQIQMGPQKEIHSTNNVLIVLICINIILILLASRACAFGNVPILEALAEVLRLWPGARCYEGEKSATKLASRCIA